MNILGLDIGEKRIGLATGTIIAEEYETLHVKSPANSFLDQAEGTGQAISSIIDIVKKERIDSLVIGLPLRADGSDSPIAQKIRQFAINLEQATNLPLALVNETLTSFAAEEMLKEEGANLSEIKQRLDQVSAKLILQQYLEEEEL